MEWTRPYTYTDPEAIQRCESMLLAFDDHQADLQTLDPDFDATFRHLWSFVQRLQHAADTAFENDPVARGLFVN